MGEYQYLFSPIKVGSMEVPNRIMMAPHALIGVQVGSDEHVGYFEARAKGGAGMIVIASCLLHENPAGDWGMLFDIHDEKHLPGLTKVVDAIHKWGSKAIVQGIWLTSFTSVKVPSKNVPMRLEAIGNSREMTLDDIKTLISQHVYGAAVAKKAGADGIEFPVGGGDGLQYFLSVLGNKRDDEYGGSLENRVRILKEIAAGIKEACGREFNVGYCVNADDSLLGGEPLETGVEACKMLADSGDVDWLRVVGGAQKKQLVQYWYPGSYMPQGTHLYAAAAVREAVDSIPIISGGRINSPEFAEQAIAEGQCDMVFAARAFICDPEWPKKAKEGREDEIRGCIGDVEGCWGGITSRGKCGCTYNPEVGLETVELVPAGRPKKITVIGGGPAGMQTALTAAQRGHKVTLIEKEDALGGHVSLEAKLPGFGDRGQLPIWYRQALDKAGVTIETSHDASAADVLAMRPDVVVVATGAAYTHDGISYMHMMPVEGIEGSDAVFTPEDILRDGKDVGHKVVVYDGTGYITGPGMAEMLADQGKDVTLVCVEPFVAKDLENLGIHRIASMRVQAKCDLMLNSVVDSFVGNTVTVTDLITYEETEIDDVDSLVTITSKPPVDDLAAELEGKVPELHVVGDADHSLWTIFGTDDAVKAGYALGKEL